MDSSIPNVILSSWFVTVANIMPMIGQWIVIPMLVIMIIVYQLIVWFINWYIFSEIGILGFVRTIISFMVSMLVYVSSYSLILVYSWEYIGLISFLLISFWQRNEAMGSSISAVMYNRLSDFSILIFCYLIESWILGILAVLSKSALWIMSYWLPIAMESPTPVSSLLHSSTIVVAGVMLSMILSGSMVLGMTAIVIMSIFLPSWFDGNKIIALSTSVHLVVIFLSVSISIYGVCLIHILTHAFVKATCFVASGVNIGMTSHQELRMWSLENQVAVIVISFLLLCGVGSSLIYNSKEMIVFQFLLMVVVLIGWNYTKVFFNNVNGISVIVINIQFSMLLIFILGGSGFGGVELIIILIIVSGLIPVFNSWSGYVVNK